MAILERYGDRPVLEPRPDGWDSVSVFNPGAILKDGKIHMLYRAVSDIRQYVSRFGLSISEDGRTFERACEDAVFEPQGDWEVGGVEDARITPEGDGFLVTYAAVSVVPGPIYEDLNFFPRSKADPFTERPGMPPFGPSYTGLLRTKDFRDFTFEGLITPKGIDDRDGVLFPEKVGGRYVLLHRPTSWLGDEYGTQQASVFLAFSEDLKTWDYGTGGEYLLMKPQPGSTWEEAKIGAGPPPIRTDAGWLMIYHGVDDRYVYRVGAALLDLENPMKVLGRTADFLMEPEMEWEKVGVIPNAIFPTANVLRGRELLVYYGAADRVVGLATADLDELLNHLS
jgi:beta-1,2-mannobiose phosphorylase / 1,2-beta-oligomannan phosphorylase